MPKNSSKTKKTPTKISKPVKKRASLMDIRRANEGITNYEIMLSKIRPFLLLGVSLRRACSQALVSYDTAYGMYKRSKDFADAVDNARDNVSNIARSKLAMSIKDPKYHEKDVKYWLDNVDPAIKRQGIKGTKVTAGDITVSVVSYE